MKKQKAVLPPLIPSHGGAIQLCLYVCVTNPFIPYILDFPHLLIEIAGALTELVQQEF